MRPAVPLQEDPGALVAQQPQLRPAVGGRAVVGDLQLAPVLRQEEIVREVGGVGHGERVGGERPWSPQTTLPVDTPPLVAVKVQPRLSQSSGPAEAAPLTVSVAPVSALAAVAAPEAVSVPVDTSPTVDGECAARDSCGAQQAHRRRQARSTCPVSDIIGFVVGDNTRDISCVPPCRRAGAALPGRFAETLDSCPPTGQLEKNFLGRIFRP